jgi:hypothetical protein
MELGAQVRLARPFMANQRLTPRGTLFARRINTVK